MKMTAIAGLAALMILSGCSETAAVQTDEKTETAQTDEAVNENDYAGETITGQVNAVSGNIAEIIPGQMVYDRGLMDGESAAPDNTKSMQDPPDSMPGNNNQEMAGGQPPEKPDGEHGDDFPGNMPEGIFVKTGEAITIDY